MAKKKATGMSKRLGFTDRATIAENKDILRFNERAEREAKGLPPEPTRGPRRGPGERGPDRGRPAGPSGDRSGEARADRPARPRVERPVRPPRPPALTPEQEQLLRDALAVGVGESGLEPAGNLLIERIAAHDTFEKASTAAWTLAAGAHASERTEDEWALLRKAWLTTRFGILEAYATINEALAPAVERERKAIARLERPQRPARPARRRGPGAPAGREGGASREAGGGGREGRPPKARRPAGDAAAAAPGRPSPAMLARARQVQDPTAPTLPAEPAQDLLPAESMPDPVSGAEAAAELSAVEELQSVAAGSEPAAVEPAPKEAEPDLAEVAEVAEAASDDVGSTEPVPELLDSDYAPPQADDADPDQLRLDL